MGESKIKNKDKRSVFDRFAENSSDLVSRAPFFVFCVALIVLWIPTYPLVEGRHHR